MRPASSSWPLRQDTLEVVPLLVFEFILVFLFFFFLETLKTCFSRPRFIYRPGRQLQIALEWRCRGEGSLTWGSLPSLRAHMRQ